MHEAGEEDEHGRGLAIVAALAGEGTWIPEDSGTPGSRVVRVSLTWHQDNDGQEQGQAS